VVRFVRLLNPADAQAVRERVAAIRVERRMPGISERTMQPPGPEAIRAFEGKRRKAVKR
jgi:hypothetical protein